MLHKGFLKSRKDKDSIQSGKKNRTFLFAGVIVVLLAFMVMLTGAGAGSSVMMAGVVMIAGMALVFISLWMNFFTQSKHRK